MPVTKVKLHTSNAKTFEVPFAIARQLLTVRTMIEDLDWNEEDQDKLIPLPNVDSSILEKIIEWAEHHTHDVEDTTGKERNEYPPGNEKIPDWDKKFLADLDKAVLFEVILAAHNVEVKNLLDFSCKYLSSLIKSKTAEQIRETFGIKNDLTPEEEEMIRRENQWCEEK